MSDAMKLVQETMADPACAQPLNCAGIENPALTENLAAAPEAVTAAIDMQVAAHVTADPAAAPAQTPEMAPENTAQPQTPTGFS